MEEERIGLFLDFENLAIGAREQLGGTFDFKPIADALAERGRVVVRRAYADWSMFGDAGRELTRHHVELIEIPQRMGAVRKNSADIKLAVDAIQLSYERDFITTFVIGTGDSDFTPLVHKLRELNKKVIGIGIEASTSSLLPPACDEFLFYERLTGVQGSRTKTTPTTRRGGGGRRRAAAPVEGNGATPPSTDLDALGVLVTQTLSGLKRRSSDVVLGSSLKRTLLRKDPTFDESVYGFRTLGEMLRNLAERNVIQLIPGAAPNDPQVDFPQADSANEEEAFELLRDVVAEHGSTALPGLKNKLRKKQSDFTEKRYGYGGFLQFCKAAEARGYIEMDEDEKAGAYVLRVPSGSKRDAPEPIVEERVPARTPLIAPPPPSAREEEPAAEPAVADVLPVPAAEPAKKPVRARKPRAAKSKAAPRKRTPAKSKASRTRTPKE
jgi:uncharacterized protein (TIGR00288 family)